MDARKLRASLEISFLLYGDELLQLLWTSKRCRPAFWKNSKFKLRITPLKSLASTRPFRELMLSSLKIWLIEGLLLQHLTEINVNHLTLFNSVYFEFEL